MARCCRGRSISHRRCADHVHRVVACGLAVAGARPNRAPRRRLGARRRHTLGRPHCRSVRRRRAPRIDGFTAPAGDGPLASSVVARKPAGRDRDARRCVTGRGGRVADRCHGRFLHRRHFDSDVVEILRPHAGALNAHVQHGDPRVLELVRKCFDLADDVGIVFEATEDADEAVTAVVRVELSGLGSPNGIAVRLRSGPFGGA